MIAKNAGISKEFKMQKNMRQVDQDSIRKLNLVVFIFAVVNVHRAYFFNCDFYRHYILEFIRRI